MPDAPHGRRAGRGVRTPGTAPSDAPGNCDEHAPNSCVPAAGVRAVARLCALVHTGLAGVCAQRRRLLPGVCQHSTSATSPWPPGGNAPRPDVRGRLLPTVRHLALGNRGVVLRGSAQGGEGQNQPGVAPASGAPGGHGWPLPSLRTHASPVSPNPTLRTLAEITGGAPEPPKTGAPLGWARYLATRAYGRARSLLERHGAAREQPDHESPGALDWRQMRQRRQTAAARCNGVR
jgi:hypothetical protein